jgi:hypothetical protein
MNTKKFCGWMIVAIVATVLFSSCSKDDVVPVPTPIEESSDEATPIQTRSLSDNVYRVDDLYKNRYEHKYYPDKSLTAAYVSAYNTVYPNSPLTINGVQPSVNQAYTLQQLATAYEGVFRSYANTNALTNARADFVQRIKTTLDNNGPSTPIPVAVSYVQNGTYYVKGCIIWAIDQGATHNSNTAGNIRYTDLRVPAASTFAGNVLEMGCKDFLDAMTNGSNLLNLNMVVF